EVVGEVETGAGTAAFLWQEDHLHLLGGLGGNWSAAYGINDGGQVVGWAETEDRRLVAFRWEAGVMTPLGTLGGPTSVAYAINEAGQAAGYSTTTHGADRAFLVEPHGELVSLGTLGGYSVAYDVDNLGRVVGESLTLGGRAHAFLWEAGRMVDLNDLLTTGSGWELSRAYAISDEGHIAGQGLLHGEPRAFLLTPVP
ncbi:MAG: HAF repeat-containing protein, partial [Deferrisomatales bacterium]